MFKSLHRQKWELSSAKTWIYSSLRIRQLMHRPVSPLQIERHAVPFDLKQTNPCKTGSSSMIFCEKS